MRMAATAAVHPVPNSEEPRLTLNLLFVVLSTGFGTWFLIGYSLTYINSPQDVIVDWIREVCCSRYGLGLEHVDYENFTQINFTKFAPEARLWCKPIMAHQTKIVLKQNLYLGAMWSLIGCAIVAGSFVVVWFIKPCTSKFGFKNTLYFTCAVALVAPVLCGCCTMWNSYEAFIVGRFFVGFSAGISSATANIYIAEVSPTRYRGAMGAIPILLYVVGMLVASILGLPQLFGNKYSWTVLSWLMFVPSLFLLVTLPFFPESPRYLLLTKQNRAEAEKSLRWFRRTKKVESEMQLIEKEGQASEGQCTLTMGEVLGSPFLRRNLLVCVAAIVGQRFTGYVAIYTYSTNIFMTSGMTRLAALYGTIGLMSLQILSNGVGMLLMDRAGRRILLLIGNCGCVIACGLLVLFSALYNGRLCEGCQYGALAAVLLFILVFNLGPGTVPWVLPAEMFDKSSRQSAVTLAMASSHLSASLVSAVFPVMLASITDWTFAVFGSITLLFTVYFWFAVTETKDKTFTEIQDELSTKFNKTK